MFEPSLGFIMMPIHFTKSPGIHCNPYELLGSAGVTEYLISEESIIPLPPDCGECHAPLNRVGREPSPSAVNMNAVKSFFVGNVSTSPTRGRKACEIPALRVKLTRIAWP